MNNITRVVWKYLGSDTTIRRGLSRNIINKRALALYIIRKADITAPTNAVISAIRRYEEEDPSKDSFTNALEAIHGATMSSKDNMVSLSLEKDAETEILLPQLFSVIQVGKNQSMRVIQGDDSIKVIIDGKNLKSTEEIIPKSKINGINKDLAEVTLHLSEQAWATPGVMALLASELSANNINIMEMITCMPEILIFFEEKDLMKAYTVLYEMFKKSKKA